MTKEIVNEQPVQTVAQSKTRNFAIEFWRFFFAIAIVGYHIGTILAPRDMAGIISASNWMAGAGEILFVFTLTAGYFLVKHFKRLQANPEYAKRKASGRAWEYLWDRIKALLPVLALGIILGIISVAIFKGETFVNAIYSTFNGLWEFTGLYSAGFGAAYGQANGAMWFISGLLICSYIIYWFMCKSEDTFAGIIAPSIFVFLGGWWAWNNTRASQVAWSTFGVQNATNPAVIGNPVTNAVIGFNNGLLFVLLGMCGGVLIYYAVEKLRTLKFNTFTKFVLSILYLVVASILVIYTINPTIISGKYSITNNTVGGGLSRWLVHLLCILLVGLTLLERDFVTELLNNKYTAKVLGYLGGCALYIYMLHMPFIYFYVEIRGKAPKTPYTWAEVFWVVTLVSIVLGCVVKFLMDKFVLRKKKVVVENQTMSVPDTAMQTVDTAKNEPKAEKVSAAVATKPATKTTAKPATKAEKPKAEKTTKTSSKEVTKPATKTTTAKKTSTTKEAKPQTKKTKK